MKLKASQSKALQQLARWSPMSGHSRTIVAVGTVNNRSWFVRKVAMDPSAAVRLERQIQKQESFAQCPAAQLIGVPRVLDSGIVEGEHYYDMEYIQGHDVASYLRYATFDQVKQFTETLCSYLALALRSPALITTNTDTFFSACYKKLVNLSKVDTRMERLESKVMERLFLGLDSLRRADLHPTLCHGDMTFENLMVTSAGRIVAIDFLDSPYEHVWQDVAKLHQDLLGEWFRLRHPALSSAVLSYIRRNIMQAIVALSPEYEHSHYVLTAITFARILPYVQSEFEREFVLSRLRAIASQVTIR